MSNTKATQLWIVLKCPSRSNLCYAPKVSPGPWKETPIGDQRPGGEADVALFSGSMQAGESLAGGLHPLLGCDPSFPSPPPQTSATALGTTVSW